MKKTPIITFLFLIASYGSYSQFFGITAGTVNNKSGIMVYELLPSAPVFSSPATITDAVGSSLESGEISGASDILVDENAIPGLFNNRLRPNGISNKRFKSAGSSRIYIGGDNVTSGQQVVATLNGSDNLSYYHIGIKGNSNSGISGISGLTHHATPGGTTVLLSDIVIKDVNFAGVFTNDHTDGSKYTSIILDAVRVFGYPVEGEGFYIGSTNKLSGFATIDFLSMDNCIAYNKGREGLQITFIADGINANCAQITNFTCYDVGKQNIAGQNNLLQVHNSNGYIKKSIFKTGPVPMNLFTHGFLFEDCYFEWDTDAPIYMGRLKASDAFGSSAIAANGHPVTFRRCIFAPTVNVTNLIRILETDCNIVFENCIFSDRISNIISDERGGSPSNTISNTGGSVVAAASIPSPTFTNFDPDQDVTHGRVTSIYHYSRHLGAFTP